MFFRQIAQHDIADYFSQGVAYATKIERGLFACGAFSVDAFSIHLHPGMGSGVREVQSSQDFPSQAGWQRERRATLEGIGIDAAVIGPEIVEGVDFGRYSRIGEFGFECVCEVTAKAEVDFDSRETFCLELCPQLLCNAPDVRLGHYFNTGVVGMVVLNRSIGPLIQLNSAISAYAWRHSIP